MLRLRKERPHGCRLAPRVVDRCLPSFAECVEQIALESPDGPRFYLHYAAANAGAPVLVFLAGTGSTADWAADETRLAEDAPAAGFHLIVPEALRPNPDEPAKFISNPPRWNDGSPAPLPELQTDADDVAFLDAVLDDLARRGVGGGRVVLCGFSNGAGMAFRYAALRSDRLLALAPIAGLWQPPEPTPARPLPTLYLLGMADPLIPYRGGEVRLPWGNRIIRRPAALHTLEAWAAAIGCDTVPRLAHEAGGVREEVYTSAARTEFRSIIVEGLGHHWPGGRGQLNPRIAGPWNDRVNLNPLLFAFARRHLNLET